MKMNALWRKRQVFIKDLTRAARIFWTGRFLLISDRALISPPSQILYHIL